MASPCKTNEGEYTIRCTLRLFLLEQVEVVGEAAADGIGVGGDIGEAGRMLDADTALNRLILHELPTLERMDGGQGVVHHVADLVADVHLVVIDPVDDTLRIARAQNQDQVVVATHLVAADELVHALVGSHHGLGEVQGDRPDGAGGLVGVFSRGDLPDDLGRAEDGHGHVRVVEDLQQNGHDAVQEVHEGLVPPLDVVQRIVLRGREVEGGGDLGILGHGQEGVVQVLLDLVVLVVAQGQLGHRQNLGQLVDIVQGADVLDLLGGDGGVHGDGRADLDHIGADLPADRAGLQHGAGGVDPGGQAHGGDGTIGIAQHETIVAHVAGHDMLLLNVHVGIGSIAGLDGHGLHNSAVDLTVVGGEVQLHGQPNLNLAISGGGLAGLGVHVAGGQVDLGLDSRNVGVDGQVVLGGSADGSQHVGGALDLGQSHLNVDEGGRCIDGVLHLVLLLVHVDLFAVGRDQHPGLHGDGELGLAGHDLGDGALVEQGVHQDVLVDGEGHADHRVVAVQSGVLVDGVDVVLEQGFLHDGLILDQLSGLSEIAFLILVGVEASLGEHALQSVAGSAHHQGLLRLRKQVDALCHQHVMSDFGKGLGLLEHGIMSVTLSGCQYGFTITYYGHSIILLSKG